MIEVELKCFIDEKTYDRLKDHFKAHAELLENTRQITHYLEGDVDTRVQISTEGGKVCQKLGKIHDHARSEIDVLMSQDDANSMLQIFQNMGYGIKISWFRHRLLFGQEEITMALDDTVGYGKILEVEILCEEGQTAAAEERLRNFLVNLSISLTPREVFEKAFSEYLATWKERTSHLEAGWVSLI
jgi:predicted adenylyl cyclase CyaB